MGEQYDSKASYIGTDSLSKYPINKIDILEI